MSTTLLYNMFGIRGYEHRRTDYHDGAASFVIAQPRAKYRCPECGSAAVHAQGHKDRFLRSLPIGGRPTFILLPVARVVCFQCELARQVKVPRCATIPTASWPTTTAPSRPAPSRA